MCKDRYKPMNHPTFLTVTTPHRWIAASVGADRYRAAIGALPIQIILSFVNILILVIFIHSCALVVHYAI